MKRILICMVALLGCVAAAWGQKSYVNVVADHIYSSIYQEIYLTGDVPVGIKTHYDSYGSEAMTSAECEVILLSRIALDPEAVPHVTADDQEAVEVARYNLQGLPVSEDEKGVQIIVYSNFTTKTIIVE